MNTGQTVSEKVPEITWNDGYNPFKDRLSDTVTVHICYANDLGQLGVDLNAVIEHCSPPEAGLSFLETDGWDH